MPKRRSSSKKSNSILSRLLTSRRFWLFAISLVVIGYLVWQTLLTLGVSSQATYNKSNVCRPQNKAGKYYHWGSYVLCNVDKPECADSCSCIPLRKGFKYGRCMPLGEVTPTPTAIPPTPTQSPPGMLTCGETCDTDSQCASGYCHDPNWQACPTETPEPTDTPKPTCVPRPSCLDSKPRCLPPEPAGGWCPREPTPTPTKPTPRPTKMCGVRGSSLVAPVKVCRDRTCFDGEQCACPIPATPTPIAEPTDIGPPADGGETMQLAP